MAKLTNRLSARGVATAKAGMHADGDGLYLVVSASGARRWVFIFFWQGKRTEMGLGSAGQDTGEVSLADARELAGKARQEVRDGINPVTARKAAKVADDAAPSTFGAFAETLVESIEGGFRNAKHRAQWRMTLSVERDEETKQFIDSGYCISLRAKRLDDIDTNDVLAVLDPIWTLKPETASRVRGRIERVLDAAKARGHRKGENPARWRGHLSVLLSARIKLKRGHHAAMPYASVPKFIEQLHTRPSSMAGLALEFAILGASRTGEVIGGLLTEVDRTAKAWTIPGERMKAGRDHRVPLTPRMLEILDTADKVREADNPYLSPAPVFAGHCRKWRCRCCSAE